MEAYCMKCKAKREMVNPKEIKMKSGRPATQGTCAKCGTKMFKIGKGRGTPSREREVVCYKRGCAPLKLPLVRSEKEVVSHKMGCHHLKLHFKSARGEPVEP